MKCTNRYLCLICAITVLLSGCGFNQVELEKEYDAYSFHKSFTNQDVSVNADYFAKELCVSNAINFNTEGTYARVAKGAGVFNLTTDEVVYNLDIFQKLYPASTTKILTAYIIIKDCDLNAVVTVSESAANQAEDSSVCGLKAGDSITVNDLLYGLMLKSGNDAAEALAEYHSGSVEAFAEVMTKEAHRLGATNSQFKNPSGLPDKEHYTTVYDMYLIMREAIKQEKFIDLISTYKKPVKYKSANGSTVEKTFTSNSRYKSGEVETPKGFEVIGGKTGTTYDAGFCLVLYSKNSQGQEIISIVFKADGRHNLYLLMNEILRKFAK